MEEQKTQNSEHGIEGEEQGWRPGITQAQTTVCNSEQLNINQDNVMLIKEQTDQQQTHVNKLTDLYKD